jgi:hypothetical protein
VPLKLSLGVALFSAVTLAAAACGSSRPASGPATSGPTVSSNGPMLDGTVQCTATLTTPAQAGHNLGVVFTFHNVSKHTIKVALAYGGMWVLVRSPDGTTYDSRVPLEDVPGPYIPPTPIAPGATKTEPLPDLRVRWGGPLRITPGCGLSALHPLRVAVASPGLPASESAALKEVVAATGHLLDRCRPTAAGVSVVGRIDPPSGNAPPLQARCSVSLRRERGFYVAQVLIVTPPDLRGVRVEAPYEGLSASYVPHRNTEAIAWQLVVTRRGVTSVNSASGDTTAPGGGLFKSWDWTGSEWQEGDRSLCGGSDGSGLGVNGPNVVFVSLCGR